MRSSFKKAWPGVVAGVSLLMASAVSTHAVPMLRVSTDNATWTTISDNGAGDFISGIDGSIGHVFVAGGWSVTVSSGITKPTSGSAASPDMDLNVVGTSFAAGSLYVEFTDLDFTPIASSYHMAIGGTTTGTAAYELWAGSTPFEQGTLLGSAGPFGAGAFSSQLSAGSPTSDPYSLTLRTVFTHLGNGTSSSDTHVTSSVPDAGSTLILLGAAMFALGMFAPQYRKCSI